MGEVQHEIKDCIINYNEYISHIFEFIDKYAASSAYIVITSKLKDMSSMYRFLLKKLGKRIEGDLFWFCGDNGKISLEKGDSSKCYIGGESFCDKNAKKYKIPICLLTWDNKENNDEKKKIIVIPSISKQSSYGRVLAKLEWVSKVNHVFNSQTYSR